METKYPVYVPSKGRFENCYTAKFLLADQTPFWLVVEPSEYEEYASRFPKDIIIVTPKDNMTLLGVRNWIHDRSKAAGDKRHWQLDDNIMRTRRLFKGKRIPCNSAIALRMCEEFTDRYTNIGLSGLNYTMFALNTTPVPYFLNVHVYSCSLINNEMPYRHRLIYNDDTDLCLQILAGGHCTVLFNAFMVDKIRTMVVKGGNTTALYQGDGRLKMARSLERVWPGVVTTDRRFQRPQHVVKDSWKHFDTQLIRRTDIDWSALENTTNEFGMQLVVVNPELKSEELKKLVDQQQIIRE